MFRYILSVFRSFPICRSRMAWGIYLTISTLCFCFYMGVFFLPKQTPQERWDGYAEWFGPARAVDYVDTSCACAYLLEMDEAATEALIKRLGCREMAPEDSRDSAWAWVFKEVKAELAAHRPGKLKLGDMYVTYNFQYLLDAEEEAKLANAMPEERLKAHNYASRMYGIARATEDGQERVIFCTWMGPDDLSSAKSPEPKAIKPGFPELHKESSAPSRFFIYAGGIVALLGINFIGNGLVLLLGGPQGWIRSAIWFLLPLAGWAGYLGMLFVSALVFGAGLLGGGILALISYAFLVAIMLCISFAISLVGWIVCWVVRCCKRRPSLQN